MLFAVFVFLVAAAPAANAPPPTPPQQQQLSNSFSAAIVPFTGPLLAEIIARDPDNHHRSAAALFGDID